jgi:hypothetical protein
MNRKAISVLTFTLLLLAGSSIASLNTAQAQTASNGSANQPQVFVENDGSYSTHYLYLADVVTTLQPENRMETYAIDEGTPTAVSWQGAVMIDKGSTIYPPTFQIILALPYLADGFHTISINSGEPYTAATRLGDYWFSQRTINFTIDTTSIAIIDLSVNNQTYSSAENITLNCVTNKTAAWTGYRIDGNQTITFKGNTTLPALADGWHTLKVYANDTAGHMATKLVYFNVAPLWPYATFALSAVFAATGLILVLRRRRKTKPHP